ncbi:alpha-tocopherol transfer protein-like [Daktulosphaira vitifoliae]|uniref:alpha-tocopherol transfer protein-like n=1 Tax=Daktulosphaira vitifoliae TaxID=58002 RepID=UPI0021AA0E8E|nr:alpha-tocopherol transfer protein-like [Daktulosphaira vitifoliae]XP_050527191.1 alpha-tocopherol transfer protein-like [Daktulosphaira vitifoliae]
MPQLISDDTDFTPTESSDDFPDVIAQLDLDTISEQTKQYARDRVGETEESRTKLLAELEDMIYEKGEVLPHRMDEAFLLRFLRARNFKLKATYQLIVNYCRFREKHPDYYSINPLNLSHIGDQDILSVMPYKDQTNRRIMIYKIGNWKTNEIDMADILKATYATLELGILEPTAQILGGVVIFDLNGFNMQHACRITPKVVSVIFELIVSSIPMKTHAVHIINESWMFDTVFNLFKPLLGKRNSEMLFFHSSKMESLHKHISPKYLPKEYGGIRPNYPYEQWFINLPKNEKIREEMLSLGFNMSENCRER